MVHVQFKIDNINMKKYKLGDFLDNYGDGIHGTPKYDINGDYYFINGSNLGNGKIVINDDTQKVSAEEYAKIRRPIVNGQTILVSINGTLGKFAIYYGEKIGLGKSACFLNLKEAIYVPFIFAILMTKEFKTYLHNIAGQSTIKNVSPNQIANYEFYTPSSLCDCIAYSQTILKINEKIELNRQINDNLEAIAKQLYDYWFVQFDFPNEEGKPYKSSGGAMVWNEKLKREIPQGWSGVSLKDLALTSRNAITPVENEVYQHFSIPSFDACGSYSLDNGSDIKSDKFVLQKGQLLVSKLNPWFNRVVWVPKGTNMIGSTEFVVLNPNNESESGYIYSVIKSPKFIAYCSQAATGTSHSQRRVSPDVLMAFKVVYEQGVVQKYGCLIEKIQKQQAELLSEIAMLTKQRDELLPLLMNGQATVNYHLSDD